MNILRGDETVANSSAGQVIIRIRTFKGWTISDPPFNNLALLSLREINSHHAAIAARQR